MHVHVSSWWASKLKQGYAIGSMIVHEQLHSQAYTVTHGQQHMQFMVVHEQRHSQVMTMHDLSRTQFMIMQGPSRSHVVIMHEQSHAQLKLIMIKHGRLHSQVMVMQGATLSSLDCCSPHTTNADATDPWSSPPKSSPHKSHLSTPTASLPQACFYFLSSSCSTTTSLLPCQCCAHCVSWLQST